MTSTAPEESAARNPRFAPPKADLRRLAQRPALIADLAQAMLNCRVVVAQAAAGFGKSLTVAAALRALPADVRKVWINLEAGDTLRSIVEALASALEALDPPWVQDPVSWVDQVSSANPDTLQPAQLRLAAQAYLQALQSLEGRHGVVVFDDMHRLADPGALHFIDCLCQALGPWWTVVLSSRSQPDFALARARASGELVLLQERQLALSLDEVALLGARHPPALVHSIWQRTSGWPAGVQLAISTLDGSPPGPSVQDIDAAAFEFLATEVIGQLPAELGQFLLALSCLPSFSEEQARRFTGVADPGRLIEAGLQRSLFLQEIDGTPRSWKFHDLFRAALQGVLRRHPDLDFKALMRRAATQASDPPLRWSCCVQAEDWDMAAQLLTSEGPGQLLSGAHAVLQHRLGQLPQVELEARPSLLQLRAWMALSRWEWQSLPELLHPAAEGFASQGMPAEAAACRAMVAVARAGMGENVTASALCDQLDAEGLADGPAAIWIPLARSWIALAEGELRACGAAYARVVEALQRQDAPALLWQQAQPLPACVGLPGMRAPIGAWVQGALRRCDEQPSALRGMALLLRSWLQLRQGDLAAAQDCYEAAAQDAQWLGHPRALAFQLVLLKAQLLALQGRAGELQACLTQALASPHLQASRADSAAARGLVLLQGARYASQAGDAALAGSMAQELLRDREVLGGWIDTRSLHGCRAILAESQGEPATALRHWKQQIEGEERSDLFGQAAEARLHAAALALTTAGLEPAWVFLRPLLERAHQDGEHGLLLLASPSVRQGLVAAPWQPDQRVWLAPCLTRLSHGLQAAAQLQRQAAPGHPLSARELEVLQRLAAGDSNKHIARAFDISPFTVKRHVGNILNKLALQSRGQAAAWYRQQGLP